MIRSCADVRCHSNGREEVRCSPLHIYALECIGIVAHPKFIKIGKNTIVGTSATACTCLNSQIWVFGTDALAYFFESFVEFYIHMALFIRRQIVGAMIHDWHVCIPFDISYFRVICHQVVYNFKYEILYFRISQVKYYLCTSTSQYRITLRGFQYPFRMLFIQFAGCVCHFRLNPDTKLDSVLLGISYQSLNAFRQLVLVYYPVAQ